MNRKSSVWTMLLSAGVAVSLTACGGGAERAGTPAPSGGEPSRTAAGQGQEAAAEPIELRVSGFKTGSELGAMNELNEKFMKEHPGIRVTYEGMPGNQFEDFIKTRFAAGDASDVIMLHPGLKEVIPYGDAGYLLDLANEPWIADFSPSSRK